MSPCTASTTDNALLHVCLQDAECLLMSLHREMQRLEHPLGGEIVSDDPLLDFHRLGRHAEGLRVEAEVEDQFLGCACDATKICIQANRVLVDNFDAGLPLLISRRLGGGMVVVCILFCHV